MTVNETCSYVFVSDKIKIINISHIQDPISPREAHAVRISNLKAFRNILMTIHVLQQDGFPWPNRDSFCFFFTTKNSSKKFCCHISLYIK